MQACSARFWVGLNFPNFGLWVVLLAIKQNFEGSGALLPSSSKRIFLLSFDSVFPLLPLLGCQWVWILEILPEPEPESEGGGFNGCLCPI